MEENEKKATYLKMALALCEIHASEKTCDLILSITTMLDKKGGDFNVHDAVSLKFKNEAKYKDATC